MAETSVKNEVCRHCGSEVRPNSQFCYSCGGALAPEAVSLKDSEKIVETSNGDLAKPTTKLKLAESPAAPLAEPNAGEEEVKLKSAASMRRQPKTVKPKQIEVIWEEHENAPNGWFILTAVLLALFVAGVFYLAIYLK